MPSVTVQNLHSKTIDCRSKKERLLDILLTQTDWMHACGGKGRCTTCRAIVLEGIGSLGPLTEGEKKFASAGRLQENERLACQVFLEEQDLTIRVPDSSKLPHLSYSE